MLPRCGCDARTLLYMWRRSEAVANDKYILGEENSGVDVKNIILGNWNSGYTFDGRTGALALTGLNSTKPDSLTMYGVDTQMLKIWRLEKQADGKYKGRQTCRVRKKNPSPHYVKNTANPWYDYVFSKNEAAYPDNGEKSEFWYERLGLG